LTILLIKLMAKPEADESNLGGCPIREDEDAGNNVGFEFSVSEWVEREAAVEQLCQHSSEVGARAD
jgi:hypothetical protein